VEPEYAHPWRTLAVLAPVPILIIYVETMIIPALPILAREFDVPLADTSWVITVFLLVGASTSPVLGRLGDIHGKKRLLLVIMGVYTASLLAAAYAPNLGTLILLRAVQGTGFAMMPITLGIVRDIFPPRKMGVAQGVISTMFGVGGSLGLFAGASITQSFGWRTTYTSILPFAVLLFLAILLVVKPSGVRHRVRIDYAGAALLMATILPLLYAIVRLPEWGPGDARVWILAAAFAFFAALFLAHERRAKAPLIDLKLLRNRDILVTNLVAVTVGFGMFTLFQTLPALVQTPRPAGFGGTVFQAGLVQLPSSLMTLATGPLNGWIVARVGPKRPLLWGLAGMAGSFYLLWAFHVSLVQLALIMILFGAAISLTMVSSINMIILASPRQHTGGSTAMNQTFRTVGGTLGPAVAAFYFAALTVQVFVDGRVETVPSSFAFGIIFLTAALALTAGLLVGTRLSNRQAGEEEPVAAPGAPEADAAPV
jgi:MFS family permease